MVCPALRLLLAAAPSPAPQPAKSDGDWVLVIPFLAFFLMSLPILYWWLRNMWGAEGRGAALSALARRTGLSFYGHVDPKLARRFALFDVLNRGENRQSRNALVSESGDRRVTAFDFSCETGQGKNRRTHRLSVAVLTSPFHCKHLLIRPERLADCVAALAGLEDIDFESHQFSKQFYVSCADRRFAYDLITPEMMALLLKHPGWTIEARGYDVLFRKGERQFTVGEFHEAVVLGGRFHDLVPEHLRKVRDARPATERQEAEGTARPQCR